MKPSIIVVGPDRVGKTTTVQHLSKMLGMPSFKAPAEKQIFKDGGASSLAFDYTLTHFLQQTGYNFVSDRGYPCEWVYSKVFNRPTDDALLTKIDLGHSNIGTKILYVYSSVPPREEDDLVPADKYWEVCASYEGFRAWTSCDVVTVDARCMLHAFEQGGDVSSGFAVHCIKELGL